jgi:hypothetical protein
VIQSDHRGWLQPFQHAVDLIDLAPIGVVRLRCARMHGGDRRLDRERSGPTAKLSLFNQGESFADQLAVPATAVLVIQQNDG